MPAKSIAQQRLMQAAEHGASFPMAKKIRSSMTHSQMHDFAVGSEKNKPMHVKKVATHIAGLKKAGYSHGAATRMAMHEMRHSRPRSMGAAQMAMAGARKRGRFGA